MSSAALEMLKNGKAKEPEPMADTTEEVDIDALKTHAQIDKVVKDYELETPDNWKALTVGQKKAYLNENYGDGDGDEEEQTGDAADPDTGDPEAGGADLHPDEAQAEEIPESTEDDGPAPGAALAKMMADAEASQAAAEADEAALETVNVKDEEPVVLETQPKKSNKKATAKEKAAEVAAPGNADEVEDFSNVVQTIENMDREASLKAIEQLSEQSGYAMFKMGGLFARIKSQGWFDPFETFEEWAGEVHGVAKRKAQYSISIYENLVNSEIPFEKCKGIKWSKLKEIAPVMTKETADVWIEKAKEMNVSNLIEAVKAHKKSLLASAGGDADATDVTKKVITRSFKLYEDQAEVVQTAIDKAKADMGADENNQALERICLDFLSSTGQGGVTVNKKDLSSAIKEVGFEKAIELVASLFPEHDITIG